MDFYINYNDKYIYIGMEKEGRVVMFGREIFIY